jgi:hypothetical protein
MNAPAAARNDVLSALFSDISADEDLRVTTLAGLVEEGRLADVGETGFSVLRGGATHQVRFRDVQTVAIEGGHGVQGALWGAAGGALAGGFFGLMIGSFNCNTPEGCQAQERRGAWGWGALLGAVGGGIGFWWGRRQVHWHPIFP